MPEEPLVPAEDAAHPVRSTLWKKLERFDRDGDGHLNVWENYDVFRAVGFSRTWAWVSALSTVAYRAPQSTGRLTSKIDLSHIGDTLLKGQTGVWDEKANAIPSRLETFLSEVNPNRDGKVRLASLRARVIRDVRASIVQHPPKFRIFNFTTRKRRFAESYSCWVQLMEVAGHREEGGVPYLTVDQVRSVFDGTLIDMILAQPRRRVSALRICTELLAGIVQV